MSAVSYAIAAGQCDDGGVVTNVVQAMAGAWSLKHRKVHGDAEFRFSYITEIDDDNLNEVAGYVASTNGWLFVIVPWTPRVLVLEPAGPVPEYEGVEAAAEFDGIAITDGTVGGILNAIVDWLKEYGKK